MTKKRVSFTLDNEAADWFRDYSKKTGLSQSTLLNILLLGIRANQTEGLTTDDILSEFASSLVGKA
jgi:hypothetical protein